MRSRAIVSGVLLAVPMVVVQMINPVTAENDPASRAVRYLQTQESAKDGSIPSSILSYSPTEDFVLAAAAAGYDPNAIDHGGPGPMDYLRSNAHAAALTAGQAGKLLQAVVAARADPTNFGGENLIADLRSAYVPSSGAYGDGQTVAQALAIQGLISAAQSVPTGAISYLHQLQDTDGGWNQQIGHNVTASDSTSTAMALMALDAAGDHKSDAATLSFLQSQQNADGGFGLRPGQPTDPASDGLVVQALIGAGQNPNGCAWTKGTSNPYTLLADLQKPDGGFENSKDTEDAVTTSQASVGLTLQAFPVVASYVSKSAIDSETAAGISALRYVRTQQSPSDGSVATSSPTYTPAEEYVIGAAAAGFDPNQLRSGSGPSVVEYLRAHAHDASSSAAATGELIQAVVAARLHATSFGGVNLVTALNAAYNSGTGVYDDGQTLTQSLAIQGLVAADRLVPAKAVAHLMALQDSDGGWNFQGSPNVSASDTNSTAQALMALAATGHHDADAAALVWLHTQQQPDGGFAYKSGAASDPASDALVVGALVATFQNPAGPGWASSSGHTAIGNLLSLQASDGGFKSDRGVEDAVSTAPVITAIERVPHPISADSDASYQAGTTLDSPAAPPPVAAWQPQVQQCPAPTASPSPSTAAPATSAPATPAPATSAPATAAPATSPPASPPARTGSSGNGSVTVVTHLPPSVQRVVPAAAPPKPAVQPKPNAPAPAKPAAPKPTPGTVLGANAASPVQPAALVLPTGWLIALLAAGFLMLLVTTSASIVSRFRR